MKNEEFTHFLTSEDSLLDTIICFASDLEGPSPQWKA